MGIELPQLFGWVISVVNFAIMFALFRLVVILPMEEAVRLREQRVTLKLKEIDDLARDAKAKLAEYEGRFGDVESVLADIGAASSLTLAQAKTKHEEKAAAQERYLLERAKAEAEAIAREVEGEIRQQMASGAVAKAEAILIKALDAGAQNAIVAAGVKKVGELRAT